MSSDDLRNLPFSAVYGMDLPKDAILCSVVNSNIKTVLLRGIPGSAKTVLARAVGSLTGKRIINIPVGIGEEQLFGGLDIETTIRTGKPSVKKGLLSESDNCIVYVDNVNLIDSRILVSLLDAVNSGHVTLEREGISSEYEFNTTLIGTMDPEYSDLSSHILDRFDLCAYSDFPEESDGRKEILRVNMKFCENSESVIQEYSEKEQKLKEKINTAVEILPLVTISDELIQIISEIVMNIHAEGIRGDLSTANAAISLAALDGRDEVTRQDVEKATKISLIHRRDYSVPPQQNPPKDNEPQENKPPEENNRDNDNRDDNHAEDNPPDQKQDDNDDDYSPPDIEDIEKELEDLIFEIGAEFRVVDYLNDNRRSIRKTTSKKGRRHMVESADSAGRYVKSRQPDGRITDIAFDATIRAAAPYQKTREKSELSINIHTQDIHEKVRERRAGCTIMFVVDASGSLGVRKRMTAVKGAILSMLKDSYVKRDKIGLMVFRRDSAELILPPTKSVEYSYRKLEELPTGGKTPLGEALVTVSEFMTSYSRAHQGELCYIALITDGRANVPMNKDSDANREVMTLAEKIHIPQVKWIVIDAASGFMKFDYSEKLAEKLEGTYFRLEDLNADRISQTIQSAIR